MDSSLTSDSNSFSSDDSFETPKQDEQFKQTFVDTHRITLRLNDFDHKIEVPQKMLQYSSAEGDEDEEDGPFLVLELKNVERLIQKESASNSKNISNIKYFDEVGVWKEMELKQRFSRNQLEKISLETITEEGTQPVKRKSGPFITVNGEEGQGLQKFNFELRLSVEGFRKQNKRVLSRLQTKEYSGLQKNTNLMDNSSSPSKLPKNFANTGNYKNEETQIDKVQLQEKVVVAPPKSQQGPITVGKSKKVMVKVNVSLPKQPSIVEETKDTLIIKNKPYQDHSYKGKSIEIESFGIAEQKPMISEPIPQDKSVTEPAKPHNKPSIKISADLPKKTLAKKPSTKSVIKKQAQDSESSDAELMKKLSVMKENDKPSTVNTNKEATQVVAEAQTSQFVPRSEFNKVVTALQSRVDELEAKLNQILQRFDEVTSAPCINTGQKSDFQGANTASRQISIDNFNLKKNRSSFFQIHEDLPDVVFAFADVMQVKKGESELKLLPPAKMLQPDLMYEKIINQLKQVELDLTVKRTPLNYKKLQEILVKKMRIVFILCHGTLRENTTNFCLENVDHPTEMDELDEARLQELLHNKIQCETIVISACHSSKLANVLHQLGNTDITVVAINSREPVLEKAAMTFNETFLQRLLEHNKVIDAYEHAIGAVGAMVQKDSKCCCCDHKHKDDCLWLKYLAKQGPEAAHELHTPKCKCYLKLKLEYGQNGHALDCKEYKKFQDALCKVDPDKFYEKAALKTNYAQMQQTSKDLSTTMCCCCVGEVMHNERDKFVILGNKDKVVFPSDINVGDLKEYKCDFSQIQLSSPNLVDRNCRAEEKISMIKFLMQDKQRVLNIMGESGVFDTLVKAVHYAVERSPKNYISKAVKINLDGIASVREITRKIFKQMMIFSQNPTEEDVISWFKHDTYKKNLSYLIIFDNYTHLERSAYLLSQANEFIQNLIEDTIKMKLVVISKSESLHLKSDQRSIKETIHFKPLQPQQLYEIFEDILTSKNQQYLIAREGKEYYKNHEIFKLQALEVSELYDIIDQLKHKSLDEIYEKIIQNWFKEKDPEIFNCYTRLQNSPKVIVDFVFLLSQIPRGICIEDIGHFKVLWPDFFEDKENLLDYVEIEEAAEEQDTSNDFNKSKSQSSDMAAISEKSRRRSSRSLLYFFEIENLNELIEDQKFTLKTFRRDALNQLLVNPPQNQSIAYKTLQEYRGLAINFLCLYGTKMLTEMIKDKRKSEVDYNIITLHLDYGIWRLDRDSKCPNFNEFQKLPLTSVEERFEVIEQSFTCIFEDWHKISNYFKASASEDEKNTVQDLFHLAKLIPSLLVELGRVPDAILFIQNLKEAATKVSNSDVLFTKLMAQMGLIQVSLQLSLNHESFDQLDQKNQKKNMEETLDEIVTQFSQVQKTEETLVVLAETYYVYALLQIQNDEQEMQQKQNANFAGRGFEMPMKELIFEPRKSLRTKKNHFKQQKSENMLQAIRYFEELKSDNYLFAISKCNLKYVRIVLEEEEAQEGITIETKTILMEILEKTDQTCAKYGNWLQQTICKILQSKVLMAGIHSQADRDKANQAINAARAVFSQKKIYDTWWLAEIVDQKQAILKEYMMEESQKLYFNFAKANPIVELDNHGCVLPNNLPIRPNGSPIELFVRGPFGAEVKNIRFPYKLDILTENLLKECVQQGIRLLHLSSDFDGSQGLAVEEEGWAKKMLSPENLKDLLLEAQGDQPCKLTLVVLPIPQSQKLAQVFYDIGVKHVIAFDQNQSKQMNKELLTALQFNYIFAFCATLYKQIAQRLDLKTAFEKANQIVNDDLLKQYISITKQEEKQNKHSKLHTRISLAQYQTIEDIGIKPILLQRPEDRDMAIYSVNAAPKEINLSTQQGILTGMLSEDINIYGHKEELYQTLKWIWNDETNPESTSLVHVRGVKDSGKSLFLRTVGRIFYQRNNFPFKISYFDFHTVDSPAKFKKVIYEMDADLKASRRTTDNKIDNHSRDILWLLDNVNELTPTLWEQFEVKLYKMCKMKNIKIVLSSTFQQEQTSTNPVFSFFEPARLNKEQGDKIYMQEIVLEEMTEDEALNILHSQCEAEFDENDLDPDTTGSLNDRIKQEPAFKDCKNLPGKIAALAKELSKKVNDKFQTFADLRKKEQQYLRSKTKRISSSSKAPSKMEKTKSSGLNSRKSILKPNNQDKTQIDRSATLVSRTSSDRRQIEIQEDVENSQTHESATPQPLVKFKLEKKNHSMEFSQ